MAPPVELNNGTVTRKTINGFVQFAFRFKKDISKDPLDLGTVDEDWNTLHKNLRIVLGIGEEEIFLSTKDYTRQTTTEAQARAKIQWEEQQTTKYLNELYQRIVQNPRFQQAADINPLNSEEQDAWDEAIFAQILKRLTAPKDGLYDPYDVKEDATPGETIIADILAEEYSFISQQGIRNPNILFKQTRTNTVFREMKDEGWITQELYDTVLNLPNIKNKPFENLTDLEKEALNLGMNIDYTDSERLTKLSRDDTSQSYNQWAQSTLRSISEDDKLNGKGSARLFPISEQDRSDAIQSERFLKDFNLWNEDLNLNKAIERVSPKTFKSDNTTEQTILNLLKNRISTNLTNYQNGLKYQIDRNGNTLTPDEINKKTFDRYVFISTRQPLMEGVYTVGIAPSPLDEMYEEERLNFAKNNPTAYWGYELQKNGMITEDVPLEIRQDWNRTIPQMENFEQLNSQFSRNNLYSLALQAKNEKIAANTEALKSLAKSAFGISTTTPQYIVDEITGTNKAVDQLAQLMSSYYTANPLTTESQQDILNNFMKVYALTPSGTIAQKQSWQDGNYSWVPGTKITIDGQTISDPDNPESIPTTYFDANVQAAQKAIDDINKDDPFAQMKAQFDESRPPAAPSFFRDPISFVERVPEPFTDQELLRDLQAAYGDSPEFLQFITPQLQRIRDEYSVTQRPGEDVTAKMTDFDARDFFMQQFEAQKPKSIKDFVNKNIDKYRTEFRAQSPTLYEQETSRIKQEQDFKNLQEENLRRQELISKPITIFRRRSR